MGERNSGLRSLSPEQRVMLSMRYHNKLKPLSPEDRHAFNKKLHAELDAMSEEQLERTKVALQAAWDRLPPGTKEKRAGRIAAMTRKSEGQRQ